MPSCSKNEFQKMDIDELLSSVKSEKLVEEWRNGQAAQDARKPTAPDPPRRLSEREISKQIPRSRR